MYFLIDFIVFHQYPAYERKHEISRVTCFSVSYNVIRGVAYGFFEEAS